MKMFSSKDQLHRYVDFPVRFSQLNKTCNWALNDYLIYITVNEAEGMLLLLGYPTRLVTISLR